MTDRLRAIEGLALVAALTAVFDGVHALGDHWVNGARGVSTFLHVSQGRVGGLSSRRRREDSVSRLDGQSTSTPVGEPVSDLFISNRL